jgi:hypothetical protein
MGNDPYSFRISQGEHTRFTASRATDQRPPRATQRHRAAGKPDSRCIFNRLGEDRAHIESLVVRVEIVDRVAPVFPRLRPDSAFNGNHEHIRTHHPEGSHRRGRGLGCVAGVRWYGTRPRDVYATCAPLPGSHPRTVLRPTPGTVLRPTPGTGTVLRPWPAVRPPRLAGVILPLSRQARAS